MTKHLTTTELYWLEEASNHIRNNKITDDCYVVNEDGKILCRGKYAKPSYKVIAKNGNQNGPIVFSYERDEA